MRERKKYLDDFEDKVIAPKIEHLFLKFKNMTRMHLKKMLTEI